MAKGRKGGQVSDMVLPSVSGSDPSYLVGERYEDGQKEQVKMQVVGLLDELIGIRDEFVGNVGENRHDNGEIVTIRFDEVVTSDGRRIDVMLAEVSQQILPTQKRKGQASNRRDPWPVDLDHAYFSDEIHLD